MSERPLRLLIVRPKYAGGAVDGDNVVHDKAIRRLSASMDVKVVELAMAGKYRRLFNLFGSAPPEIARHIAPENRQILAAAAESHSPDVICLFNETTFPVTDQAKQCAQGVVLYAHNVHSQIVNTDKGLAASIFGAATRRFERRFYGDPRIELVCISRSDARYLRASGIRSSAAVVVPGAPPNVPLRPGAPVERALVLTGSYGWWRKRRDLKRFAAGAHDPGVACYVADTATRYVAVPGAQDITGLDWSTAIRFGIITDCFTGGFKLKSTEYVAQNCAILSFADISEEFAGLPHAETFVRTVTSRAEAEQIARRMADDGAETVAKFATFKAACLERFDWSRTLEPLERSVARAAGFEHHVLANDSEKLTN